MNEDMERKDAAIRMLIFKLSRCVACGECPLSPRCGSKRGDMNTHCMRQWAEETKDFMRRVNIEAQPDCDELAFIKSVLDQSENGDLEHGRR